MRGAPLALALLLAMAVCAVAEEAPAEDQIEPDRPDVSDDVRTIAPGAVQLETGLEYARERAAASETARRLALEASLRVGLGERLELRLEGEPLVHLRGPDDDTGHGDVTLALKHRFRDASEASPWPALGLLPFVKLPLADEPLGSERADFGLGFLANLDLPWSLSLDANAGAAVLGQKRPEGHLVQALVSAALSRSLGERLSAYGELFFASREERDGRDRLGLDAGLVFLVTARLAVDAAVETTLDGAGPDYALRAGLSVLFEPR
jgi:hypothetical protein